MELTDELKSLFVETAQMLKSSERRIFMAQVVKRLGKGGQRRAERELGWNRRTIRLGMHELESGFRCVDAFSARGRKRAEDHLPNLLADIDSILEEQSQADPTFKTTQLYTRISAAEVRRQLIAQKGYSDAELPCEETIRVKINQLGYTLRSVQKSQPKKRSGIVSFDLEMAGDRFTLFRGSSVREGAEVPRNEQETAFSVHLGRHSAQKV